MTTLLISEVAERTGFSATTLRYYEAIGLLPPAERTVAGYRTYGEDAVRRLHLIGRAKGLGLSLDEVRDLAERWDGEPCAAVQEHLGRVVAAKAAEGRVHLQDLHTFVVGLDQAAAALGQPVRPVLAPMPVPASRRPLLIRQAKSKPAPSTSLISVRGWRHGVPCWRVAT